MFALAVARLVVVASAFAGLYLFVCFFSISFQVPFRPSKMCEIKRLLWMYGLADINGNLAWKHGREPSPDFCQIYVGISK